MINDHYKEVQRINKRIGDRNISHFKLKSIVLFIRIISYLRLPRPFGNIISNTFQSNTLFVVFVGIIYAISQTKPFNWYITSGIGVHSWRFTKIWAMKKFSPSRGSGRVKR